MFFIALEMSHSRRIVSDSNRIFFNKHLLQFCHSDYDVTYYVKHTLRKILKVFFDEKDRNNLKKKQTDIFHYFDWTKNSITVYRKYSILIEMSEEKYPFVFFNE